MLVLSKEYECGVVEWAAGKLIGLMNVARDITCRHSISESLEKREEGRKEGGERGARWDGREPVSLQSERRYIYSSIYHNRVSTL